MTYILYRNDPLWARREERRRRKRKEKKENERKIVMGNTASLNCVSNIYFLNKRFFANSKNVRI